MPKGKKTPHEVLLEKIGLRLFDALSKADWETAKTLVSLIKSYVEYELQKAKLEGGKNYGL